MLHGELLANCFGILPKDVHEVKGGWSAKAYRVDAGNFTYFLKVYDKTQPSVQPWIKRIDAYISVLGWLCKTKELRGFIAEPIPSLNGNYKVETADHVFLLFTFVKGDTPGERGMSPAQIAELAYILAQLHSFGESIPCDISGLHEDVSLSLCYKLEHFISEAQNHDTLSQLICPNANMISSVIAETLRLRDTARLPAKSLVLCHTDAHHNNVIQGDRLVLVDWEDLRLAPAEADLFMYALNPEWPTFWQSYSAFRRDFQMDTALMRFYILKRRLEDIWYYMSRVLLDKPSEVEASRIYGRLRSIFSETQRLFDGEINVT